MKPKMIIQVEEGEITNIIADSNIDVCVQNGSEDLNLDFTFPVQIYTPLRELNVNQTA